MHHSTLTRCLAALGLSACTSTPATIEPSTPRTPEPSGLGMDAHTQTAPRDSGPRFVSEQDEWCQVWIDTNGRALEPTPSFLQAWNLVAARGQVVTRYVHAPPRTEDDARTRICGRADCSLAQPQIIRASLGGGSHAQPGSVRAGFGVLVPTERGSLVVPVVGSEGECPVAPELRVEQAGSLVHLTALVHEGHYARHYFHGDYGHYGGYPSVGGCQGETTWRTDIVIDVETTQLELMLTQGGTPQRTEPWVEVRLEPRGVELEGCSDVLSLSWTG